MSEIGAITWRGKSGHEYKYTILRVGTAFDAVPGNYLFAEETSPGLFMPIYIGQSSNLSEGFEAHYAMPCIKRNRATYIHVHLNSGDEQARHKEETDLIAYWDPPCNRTRTSFKIRASLVAR